MSTDLLVALSNVAVVVVTGALIFVSVRDAHRHASDDLSAVLDADDAKDARLVHVIDRVLDERDAHVNGASK